MATNELALYNIALAALGERTLDSTAENRPTRRELDKVWNRGDGAIKYALEQGLWNFAITRTTINSSSSAAFGYSDVAALPSDYVRLVQVSTDTDMADPLIRYEIEGQTILSESSIVYMRYVSNSTAGYGGDMGNWPETFTLYVGHWLATQIYPTVKQPRVSFEDLQARTDILLANARQKNAAEGPRPFPERDMGTIEHRELDYPLELMARVSPRRQQQ